MNNQSKLIYESHKNGIDIFIYSNETNPQFNETRYVINATYKEYDSNITIQKWFLHEHNAVNVLLKHVKNIFNGA